MHSSNKNSSSEMVYMDLSPTNQSYQLRLSKSTDNEDTVSYGYAWSTDNNQKYYQIPTMEGIYYLRNKKSALYLGVINTGSDVFMPQNVFNGLNQQQWIVRRGTEEDTYQISTGDIENPGELSRYSTKINNATIKTVGKNNIRFLENGDGTYSILLQNTSTKKWEVLGIVNNSTSAGVYSCWNVSNADDSQKWYLERLNYRKGDVNQDGAVDSDDAVIVLRNAVELMNLTEAQKFLADVDGNGEVNTDDSTLILQMVTNE